MRNLKEYVNEGLADWSDDKLDKKISKQTTKSTIKNEIIDWICNNYTAGIYPRKKIAKNKLKIIFDDNGIVVNYDSGNICVSNYNIEYLTNGLFKWGEIGGYFICSYCQKLKSLEGAPEKVGGDFNCSDCSSLESLEGAPKETGRHFNCQGCDSLKNLEGSSEKVGLDFYCQGCKSLKSLEGGPKEVARDFYCFNCGTKFTEDDVKKVSNVKYKIICKQW